jgi:hypothetical protein
MCCVPLLILRTSLGVCRHRECNRRVGLKTFIEIHVGPYGGFMDSAEMETRSRDHASAGNVHRYGHTNKGIPFSGETFLNLKGKTVLYLMLLLRNLIKGVF